jgi:hypothetical protein
MNKMIEIFAWIGNRIGKPPGWERLVRLVCIAGEMPVKGGNLRCARRRHFPCSA